MTGELEQLARRISSGETSAVAVVEECLARIEQHDDELNSFVCVDAERARARALEVDRDVAAGRDVGPLGGIPFGVKDLDDAAGLPTRRGSRWFADAAPATRDDLHVARLRAAGAIVVGKTTTPELGAEAITTSAITGVTRNPWDPTKTPGGSSGGTAAAVAGGLIPFGTASDGGGSIRSPAGFCGLPGLRPAYGRVATYGSTHVAQNAVSFALARTVADTALLLDVCAGPSPFDRTSLPAPTGRFVDALEHLDVRGLRVAFSPAFGFGPVEAAVEAPVRHALAVLVEAAGLEVVEADLDLPPYLDTYTKVEGVDRWIGLAEGLWPEREAELSDAVRGGWASASRAPLPRLGAVYTARRELEHRVAELFASVDVIATPTTGVAAFAAEGPLPSDVDGQPVHPFVGFAQPILGSLCNLPGISIPAGLTPSGLPVGLLLNAPLHREDLCLRLGHLAEQALGTLRPPRDLGPLGLS